MISQQYLVNLPLRADPPDFYEAAQFVAVNILITYVATRCIYAAVKAIIPNGEDQR